MPSASRRSGGGGRGGCVHTATSTVIFRVAQCNTRTHFAHDFAALLATEQGDVAQHATRAPAQAADVTTLTSCRRRPFQLSAGEAAACGHACAALRKRLERDVKFLLRDFCET